MSETIRLWLDDERPMPSPYNLHCRTAEAAMDAIREGNVVEVSLDFYLGACQLTGLEVAEFIAAGAESRTIKPMRVRIHTSCQDAAWEMKAEIRKAKLAWMAAEQASNADRETGE